MKLWQSWKKIKDFDQQRFCLVLDQKGWIFSAFYLLTTKKKGQNLDTVQQKFEEFCTGEKQNKNFWVLCVMKHQAAGESVEIFVCDLKKRIKSCIFGHGRKTSSRPNCTGCEKWEPRNKTVSNKKSDFSQYSRHMPGFWNELATEYGHEDRKWGYQCHPWKQKRESSQNANTVKKIDILL